MEQTGNCTHQHAHAATKECPPMSRRSQRRSNNDGNELSSVPIPSSHPHLRHFLALLVLVAMVAGSIWLFKYSGYARPVDKAVRPMYTWIKNTVSDPSGIRWGHLLIAGVIAATPILLIFAFLSDTTGNRWYRRW